MLASARLTIDLEALVANYKEIAESSAGAKTAAVVKADAYGLGVEHVAPALSKAGCDTFFVALPEEGITLRRIIPEADIYVLAGMIGAIAAAACAESSLTPVLNTTDEIKIWADYWKRRGSRRPCAIHVDTGMNRLGLPVREALAFAKFNELNHRVTPVLLISHLACADERDHPLNEQQLESFQALSAAFGNVDSSLANSAGVFLGTDYHFDLTRPGISIYGGAPQVGEENPMRPVVTAEARILQIRDVRAGETVSYGATFEAKRDGRIAVAGIGYADGYHRSSSGHGVALREARSEGAFGSIAGHRIPVIGRVTMDLTAFDITELPEETVKTGDWIELFGTNISIDEAARSAGTIAYELLTGLGNRYYRRHVGAEV
ncbi:MAG: alanine racemase [Rhizobiaceae bacterium]